MNQVEIPQYFLCPISLQIMKDPVTAVTGITYDRESIQKWLSGADHACCPVTKQVLPRDTELIPNHMLRRLIQAWCSSNAEHGIDRIPTPKSPMQKSQVLKLIRDLSNPATFMESLKKMEELATEDEKNRKCMDEAGVVKCIVHLIVKRFNEREIQGLQEALKIFHLVCSPSNENRFIVNQNHGDLIQLVLRIMNSKSESTNDLVKIQAMSALKKITEVLSSNLLEGLNPEFFVKIVSLLRTNNAITQQTTKATLHVLIQACPWGRNKLKIIEAGAVFELIELELCNLGKRVSELVFSLLSHLCSIADGRQQFLRHAGAIALVSKRTLRVSAMTDDRAVHILAMISRCSATKEVTLEMLRVGAVAKLCMLLQADCEVHLKKKAREILRLHSNVWSNSPCIRTVSINNLS